MSDSEPTPSAADHNATEQADQTTEQAVEVPEPEEEETQVTSSGPADQVVEVAEEVVDPKDGDPKGKQKSNDSIFFFGDDLKFCFDYSFVTCFH